LEKEGDNKTFSKRNKEREREKVRKKETTEENSWLFPNMTSKLLQEYKDRRICQVRDLHMT